MLYGKHLQSSLKEHKSIHAKLCPHTYTWICKGPCICVYTSFNTCAHLPPDLWKIKGLFLNISSDIWKDCRTFIIKNLNKYHLEKARKKDICISKVKKVNCKSCITEYVFFEKNGVHPFIQATLNENYRLGTLI